MPPLDKVVAWAYRWLPIIFGCHCKPDRSFILRGRQFPICARCTGELIGMLAGVVCCFAFRPPVWICILLMLPMIADGLIQRLTTYESSNIKRVITGTLFGYALVTFVVITLIATFRLGVQLGKQWNL